MKKIMLFLLLSPAAFAYSTLNCTNNDVSYSFHDRVGGAHPFPGMITNVEVIKKSDKILYRQVWRHECRDLQNCHPQQPDLTNIIPENFSFQFDQDSKKVLSSEGDHSSPVFKETYVIIFNLDQPQWVLCDYERLLLP